MTPFLLVSRSAEYESRMRGLLGDRLAVVAGEFLTFGVDAVIDRIDGSPRIALLGPVLNFEETRGLARELTGRHPDVGLVVVREQRSDLEDWVDELSLHAVLSPLATDETTTARPIAIASNGLIGEISSQTGSGSRGNGVTSKSDR